MQIVENITSKYGSFDLLPTPGFVISHHFIDCESKLLIVAENTVEDSKKHNIPVPSYTRVFDPIIPKELSFEEYRHYFNYEKETIFSDDGKLKLVSQRTHHPEPLGDAYEEQLYNNETGELISKSSGVAFLKCKRNNLIDSHYFQNNLQQEQEERQKTQPKQFCPVCGAQVNYSLRYPKAICKSCKSKITDCNGRPVEFFNTEFLGYGCQGYYSGTNQKELYDSTACYIGTVELVANEHRFGGIVIQTIE